MADKFYLTIILNKEVPDVPTAKALLEVVKTRMEDKPDVKVTGQVGIHFGDGE